MAVLIWIVFVLFVLTMVMLDLGVFHRKAHVVGVKEALAWTAVWIMSALAFNVLVYFFYAGNWFGWTEIHSHDLTGREAAIQYFTGYVLEKSLSVDNIFVIALIFAYFAVPLAEQHRVLFWGILGAVVLRGVMIAFGAFLISRFEWIIYVFGAFLIFTAVRMLLVRHEEIHPDKNPLVRLVRKIYPVASEYPRGRFFTRVDGRRAVTPLMLALILVETSDVMFAVDSIPAIFAITRDPFLVFTSNVFAILGLRSLYFVLANLIARFRYLKISLVFVLAYVGVKMLLSHHYPIPNLVSLAIIAGIFCLGILASTLLPRREAAELVSQPAEDAKSPQPSAAHEESDSSSS